MRPLQANQSEAPRLLRDQLKNFLVDDDGALQRTQHNSGAEKLRKKRTDYSGYVGSKVVPFTREQGEASWPTPVLAAESVGSTGRRVRCCVSSVIC